MDREVHSTNTLLQFCNQYAAMPSLHFGYSLLVGLSIAFIPLRASSYTDNDDLTAVEKASRSSASPSGKVQATHFSTLLQRSPTRLACLAVGFSYPTIILIAIVATANHFILDAIAGATVCAVAWNCDRFLLNLLPLEDWLLWALRTHKPEPESKDVSSA